MYGDGRLSGSGACAQSCFVESSSIDFNLINQHNGLEVALSQQRSLNRNIPKALRYSQCSAVMGVKETSTPSYCSPETTLHNLL